MTAGRSRTARRLIAHRGVHLGSTIAGENSLEAVNLARRAGFACIETDVRLSSDGELVIMHDETLNRTATDVTGAELSAPVLVSDVPLSRLRTDYRLKARDVENRVRIPTLEEYLTECARAELLPFIEIKLNDQPPAFYRRVLDVADAALGRRGYVMTSNGNANRRLREMGVHDVPLMDIRHQAPTFEDVAELGDVTVAVSATRYTRREHAAHVAQARAHGLSTESHADDFSAFTVASAHDVDLISTDTLAPDLRDDAQVTVHTRARGSFEHEGRIADGELGLEPGETVALPRPWAQPRFGGLFLALEIAGTAEVRLGPQGFRIENERLDPTRHHVLLDAMPAAFVLTAVRPCRIRSLEITVAEY